MQYALRHLCANYSVHAYLPDIYDIHSEYKHERSLVLVLLLLVFSLPYDLLLSTSFVLVDSYGSVLGLACIHGFRGLIYFFFIRSSSNFWMDSPWATTFNQKSSTQSTVCHPPVRKHNDENGTRYYGDHSSRSPIQSQFGLNLAMPRAHTPPPREVNSTALCLDTAWTTISTESEVEIKAIVLRTTFKGGIMWMRLMYTALVRDSPSLNSFRQQSQINQSTFPVCNRCNIHR